MSEFDQYLLPLDPTGKAESNHLVTQHPILTLADTEYQQIVPRQGLFYTENVTLSHIETGVVLKRDVDFYIAYDYRDFYDNYGREVAGSIVLTNKSLQGNLILDAHYVGGDYSVSEDGLIPALVTADDFLAIYDWSTVVAVPTELPPISHQINTSDLTTGFDDVTAALWKINDSLVLISQTPKDIPLENVIGLEDALSKLVSNARYNKLSLGELFAEFLADTVVEVKLPLPNFSTRVEVELGIKNANGAGFSVCVSGNVSPTPTAVSGDFSQAADQPYLRYFNLSKEEELGKEVYLVQNKDGVYLLLAGLTVDNEEDILGITVNRVVWHEGIDVDDTQYLEDLPISFTSLGIYPGLVDGSNITAKFDNTHLHDIDDITGLQQALEDLNFTTPYTMVDDPTTVPAILGLNGYIFDCERGMYTIETPLANNNDKAITNGDTLDIQIKTTTDDTKFVVLVPAEGFTIMGDTQPIAFRSQYANIRLTLMDYTTWDGVEYRDWRFSSAIGEIDSRSSEESATNTLKTYSVTYVNKVGTSNFFGLDKRLIEVGNHLVSLNGLTLTNKLDYKIESNGSITLINSGGVEKPLEYTADTLTITIFEIQETYINNPVETTVETRSATVHKTSINPNTEAVTPRTLAAIVVKDTETSVRFANVDGFDKVELMAHGLYRLTYSQPVENIYSPIFSITAQSGVDNQAVTITEIKRTETYYEFKCLLDAPFTPPLLGITANLIN